LENPGRKRRESELDIMMNGVSELGRGLWRNVLQIVVCGNTEWGRKLYVDTLSPPRTDSTRIWKPAYTSKYTVVSIYPASAVNRGSKKLKNKEINGSLKFKTRSKRERAVTWWNPAAQTRPVLDSPSFVPSPTLPRITCLDSSSSVLAVRISCRVIAVFVFRKPLFFNQTLPYLCLLHEYHVVYSVRYYPRSHITAVGTYYP
jgi:hypothetical protein